jgi:hypothetical protein
MGLVGRLVGFDHGLNARESAIAATGGVAERPWGGRKLNGVAEWPP